MVQGTARQIHSIATHPSQPDKCASGGSNGTIAVWDLRFTRAPLAASTGKQSAGDVWQVSYFWEAQAATVCNLTNESQSHITSCCAMALQCSCFKDDCTTIQQMH